MIHAHFIAGGFDSIFHFRRIMELEASLKHFVLPQFGINYFHGSAVMTLYPYLNLLPFILISFFVKSKILVFYYFIGLWIFISFLTSFFGSIRCSNSWRISYLFSLFYTLSNLYMYYGFGFSDIGVVSSLAWLPLVVFGFIEFLKDNKWMELSIGMTLIIFSHVLTVIIVIVLLLFWLIINFRKINFASVINILKAVGLTILSTAVVWVPALLFHSSNSITPPDLIKLSGSPISSIMKDDWTSYGIGLIALIGFIFGLIFYKMFTPFEKQMYIISIISIFICSNLFPWYHLPSILSKYLEYFQYTSRFLIIPQIMLSYLAAVSIIKPIHKIKTKNIMVIIMALLSIGLQLQSQFYFVRDNVSNHVINNHFINKYTTNYGPENQFHNFAMPFKTSSSTNIFTKTPNYKVINNSDYCSLINANNSYFYKDYDTKISKFYNEVQSNKGIINSHYISVFNCGFNKFEFYNNKSGKITMPIFYYNHEKVNAYIDDKRIDIYHNKGLMKTNNVKSGNHVLKIVLLPSYHLNFGILLTIVGCIGYLLTIIKLMMVLLTK